MVINQLVTKKMKNQNVNPLFLKKLKNFEILFCGPCLLFVVYIFVLIKSLLTSSIVYTTTAFQK